MPLHLDNRCPCQIQSSFLCFSMQRKASGLIHFARAAKTNVSFPAARQSGPTMVSKEQALSTVPGKPHYYNRTKPGLKRGFSPRPGKAGKGSRLSRRLPFRKADENSVVQLGDAVDPGGEAGSGTQGGLLEDAVHDALGVALKVAVHIHQDGGGMLAVHGELGGVEDLQARRTSERPPPRPPCRRYPRRSSRPGR